MWSRSSPNVAEPLRSSARGGFHRVGVPIWDIMGKPVFRIALFPERPDFILIMATKKGEVQFPPLVAPFDRFDVHAAFRDAQMEVRSFETVPGRWSQAMMKMANEEKAERSQRAKLDMATQVAIGKQSVSTTVRGHSEALGEKLKIDQEIRDLKVELGNIRSNSWATGRYIDPSVYRSKEKRLEDLKLESQALQNRMGELKKAERQRNIEANSGKLGRFKAVAKKVLPPETFNLILAQAEKDEAEAEAEAQDSV